MSKRSIKKVRHYNNDLTAKAKVSSRKSCPPPYPHRQAQITSVSDTTDADVMEVNDDELIPPYNPAHTAEHDAMIGFFGDEKIG